MHLSKETHSVLSKDEFAGLTATKLLLYWVMEKICFGVTSSFYYYLYVGFVLQYSQKPQPRAGPHSAKHWINVQEEFDPKNVQSQLTRQIRNGRKKEKPIRVKVTQQISGWGLQIKFEFNTVIWINRTNGHNIN